MTISNLRTTSTKGRLTPCSNNLLRIHMERLVQSYLNRLIRALAKGKIMGYTKIIVMMVQITIGMAHLIVNRVHINLLESHSSPIGQI